MDINSALSAQIIAPNLNRFYSAPLSEGSRTSDKNNADRLTLSAQGLLASEKALSGQPELADNKGVADNEASEKSQNNLEPQKNNSEPKNSEELSDTEKSEIEELKRRDTEVRAHEQAHKSAAGNLVKGGAHFSFETGPDGKRYAVGGEVSIDTSTVEGDPQASLVKAQQIKQAANAPAQPSAQDRSVAAQASQMEVQARKELAQEGQEKQKGFIDDHTPQANFFDSKIANNTQAIQNRYQQIQNSNIAQQSNAGVDVFI